MSTPAEEVVQRQVEAYSARDLASFLACYAPDVRIENLPGGDLVADSREAMEPIYRSLFARVPDLACEIENRIVHGDFVVDHEKVRGVPGKEALRAVAIYHVTDGAIRRVWFLREAQPPK